METTASVVNAIVNNSVPLQLTHQSDAASNHSHPALLSGKLVALDSVINCIGVRTVQWPDIWKFILMSYIIALPDLRQQMMHRKSGQTQLAEKIMTSRIYQK